MCCLSKDMFHFFAHAKASIELFGEKKEEGALREKGMSIQQAETLGAETFGDVTLGSKTF